MSTKRGLQAGVGPAEPRFGVEASTGLAPP